MLRCAKNLANWFRRFKDVGKQMEWPHFVGNLECIIIMHMQSKSLQGCT